MKKKKIKPVIVFLLFALLLMILYFMFRDSYQEILEQMKHARKGYLALMLLLGNGYVILDGAVYFFLLKRSGESCSFFDGVKMAYLGIFLSITTMGSGTKAGQIYYLYQRETDPGKSFGLLTLSYVLHKLTIVLYACLMLLFSHSFLQRIYKSSTIYLYSGVFFSIVIIVCLILICLSSRFHHLLLSPLQRWVKKPAWKEKVNYVQQQLSHLRAVTHTMLQDKTACLIPILIFLGKMTCWYLLPGLAYYALADAPAPCSFFEMAAAASVMQLLIGIFPSTNGLGSTEIVYLLLFHSIFGDVTAGSTMILYRMANYYFPFLVSLLVTANIKKIPPEES